MTTTQRNKLFKLLHKFKELFNGTLGTWKIYPIYFKLKEYTKPICLLPHPVPKVHEEIFKEEVYRLFILGVLEVATDSEWGSPSFAHYKPKSNQVCLLSDIRSLNKQSKQKP